MFRASVAHSRTDQPARTVERRKETRDEERNGLFGFKSRTEENGVTTVVNKDALFPGASRARTHRVQTPFKITEAGRPTVLAWRASGKRPERRGKRKIRRRRDRPATITSAVRVASPAASVGPVLVRVDNCGYASRRGRRVRDVTAAARSIDFNASRPQILAAILVSRVASATLALSRTTCSPFTCRVQ